MYAKPRMSLHQARKPAAACQQQAVWAYIWKVATLLCAGSGLPGQPPPSGRCGGRLRLPAGPLCGQRLPRSAGYCRALPLAGQVALRSGHPCMPCIQCMQACAQLHGELGTLPHMLCIMLAICPPISSPFTRYSCSERKTGHQQAQGPPAAQHIRVRRSHAMAARAPGVRRGAGGRAGTGCTAGSHAYKLGGAAAAGDGGGAAWHRYTCSSVEQHAPGGRIHLGVVRC